MFINKIRVYICVSVYLFVSTCCRKWKILTFLYACAKFELIVNAQMMANIYVMYVCMYNIAIVANAIHLPVSISLRFSLCHPISCGSADASHFFWPILFGRMRFPFLVGVVAYAFAPKSLLVFAMCIHTSSSNISFVIRVCFPPLLVPRSGYYLSAMKVGVILLLLFLLCFFFPSRCFHRHDFN